MGRPPSHFLRRRCPPAALEETSRAANETGDEVPGPAAVSEPSAARFKHVTSPDVSAAEATDLEATRKGKTARSRLYAGQACHLDETKVEKS